MNNCIDLKIKQCAFCSGFTGSFNSKLFSKCLVTQLVENMIANPPEDEFLLSWVLKSKGIDSTWTFAAVRVIYPELIEKLNKMLVLL